MSACVFAVARHLILIRMYKTSFHDKTDCNIIFSVLIITRTVTKKTVIKHMCLHCENNDSHLGMFTVLKTCQSNCLLIHVLILFSYTNTERLRSILIVRSQQIQATDKCH